MKNTKSRKKMLISSVAMLLVALVALGSATYAWFSVSKSVYADTIKVKAITTAGLEISNTGVNGHYDTSVSFNDATPVSIKPIAWNTAVDTSGFVPSGNVDGTTGAYTTTGAGSYKDIGTVPSIPGTVTGAQEYSNGYFAVYKVWVRSAAEADGTTYNPHDVEAKVEATYSGSDTTKDGTKFVRAKLVDETDAAAQTPAGNSKNFWDANTGTTSVVSSTAGATTTGVSFVKYNTYGDVSDTDNSAAGREYTLYVWYDGADADCKDTAADSLADIKITFSAKDM